MADGDSTNAGTMAAGTSTDAAAGAASTPSPSSTSIPASSSSVEGAGTVMPETSAPAEGTTATSPEGSTPGTSLDLSKGEDKKDPSTGQSELPDETPIKVGDAEATVGELKEAFQLVDAAVGEVEKYKGVLKNVESWSESLRKTPADALMHFFTKEFEGDQKKAYAHIVSMAEKILQKHVELESMSPVEREALELKAQMAEMRAQIAAFKGRDEATRREAAEKVEEQRFSTEISAALTKIGLKPSESSIGEVASVMLRDRELGLKTTAAEAVMKLSKNQAKQRLELLRGLKPEDVPAELRQALLQKSAEDVRKARSAPAQAKTPSGEPKTEEEPQNPVMGTSDLWGWNSFRK